MQRCEQLRPSPIAKLLPSLLIFGLCALFSGSAWAQAASATDHAPAAVNLSNTPLDQSRTPQEVTNGTANLLGRHDADAKLRLVLGLNPPKLGEEEKFLQQLQNKKSPNYHQYLTAEN